MKPHPLLLRILSWRSETCLETLVALGPVTFAVWSLVQRKSTHRLLPQYPSPGVFGKSSAELRPQINALKMSRVLKFLKKIFCLGPSCTRLSIISPLVQYI